MEEVREGALEAFLAKPEAYGLGAHIPVTRIDTHISIVFLAGTRAYKLKKSVDFGYLDFTSLDKRRAACAHELELNRRTAPAIYLRTVPVHRTDNGFLLGGDEGEVVDWLVEMVRFEQSDVLSARATAGTLSRETIEELARTLSHFHGRAEVRLDAGGAARFAAILKSSEENYAPYIGSLYSRQQIEHLNDQVLDALRTVGPLLDARRDAGWVRHCHGDLHLNNVALIDDVPVPFDCIEFNDDFARVDILYDLSFLLMDLEFRAKGDGRLRGFANAALNAYLQASPVDDWVALVEGLQALPLFMSARAGVRSHVNARTWESLGESVTSEVEKQSSASLTHAYADLAFDLLAPTSPQLCAVGGLSGTGKTTLAKPLAGFFPGPVGAVHLRTDVLRKKLAGVDVSERLPASAYTQSASDAVYEKMMEIAATSLAAGQSVICDAVFAKPAEREAIEGLASDAGVSFSGIWLTADQRALEARVDRRTRTEKDASDATVDVVRQQLSYELGDLAWQAIDSNGSPEEVLARTVTALGFM